MKKFFSTFLLIVLLCGAYVELSSAQTSMYDGSYGEVNSAFTNRFRNSYPWFYETCVESGPGNSQALLVLIDDIYFNVKACGGGYEDLLTQFNTIFAKYFGDVDMDKFLGYTNENESEQVSKKILKILSMMNSMKGNLKDAGTYTNDIEFKFGLLAYLLETKRMEIEKNQYTNSSCKALTRVAKRNIEGVYQHVGCDYSFQPATCDPYVGDTPIVTELPLGCFLETGEPGPTWLPIENFDNSRSYGKIMLTEPVRGETIDSREQANTYCEREFGEGWRMIEFHDGNQWNLWAEGNVEDTTRFWVAIDDKSANPWDCKA